MTSAAADNAQRPLTPDNEMAPSGGRITDLGWICALYELGQKAANGAHPQQVRQEIQAVLESGADDDLVGLADNATGTLQILLKVAA